ncbi:hypothetical protein FQA39_LY03308 [Lamprigera yunnana]|nr:hypothetical protein FQA39_LY03308 [Lamprigera yunnana]
MNSKLEDLPSVESDMLKVENDDTEDPNFEEYSESSSNDGDDIRNPTLDSISGYITPICLDWSLEPPAKIKFNHITLFGARNDW